MSTIKITNLTSSGAIVGNVVLPVVGNVAGTLTTLKATVDQLKTFITASAEANILAANAATIFANTNMKLYVDGQITAANAGVTAANIGMKGYVDSVASQSIYGNANVASYLHANNYNPYSNVNVAVFTNLSTYAYSANVTAANLGVVGYINNSVSTANIGIIGYIDNQVSTANTAMKGYVDNQTYSNVQVSTYLPTYSGNIGNLITPGFLAVFGNVFVANTYVPTLANSTGLAGQVVWDSDYIYICVATDTWKRANIATW